MTFIYAAQMLALYFLEIHLMPLISLLEALGNEIRKLGKIEALGILSIKF